MMTHKFRPLCVARLGFIALASLAPLAGCTDFSRAVGWEKAQPDEFQVVQQAPLEQPPDYLLRPPAPGAQRPQEDTPSEQAQALLSGNAATASADSGLSPGEQALLAKAGADKAPSNIRQQVDAQTTALIQASPSLVDRLMFWRDAPPSGTVINPNTEVQTLKKNANAGVPQIQREQSGVF